MDNVVAAGTRTTKSGESYLDISKIGQELASQITPESAVYDIGADGKELKIEFSNEDMKKILAVGGMVNKMQQDQQAGMTNNTSANPDVKISKYDSPSMIQAKTGQFSTMAGLRSSLINNYGSYESHQYDILLATEEEKASGKMFKTKAGHRLPEGHPDTLAPSGGEKEVIRTCACIPIKNDETGEYEVHYYGDPIAIESAKKAAAASDFKDQALEVWRRESMRDVYNLAQELRRYNSALAEQLLWFQHEAETEEFDAFKDICLKKLREYREKDPLALIKSAPITMSDGNIHMLDPKPASDEELDRYMKKLESLCDHEETQAEKEQKAIDHYIKTGDRLKGVREEIAAIKNGKDTASIVKQLQMMTDIMVCTSQEEYDHEMAWRAKVDNGLDYARQNRRNQYNIWKQIMRVCEDQVTNGLTYDQWFDLWWAKPDEEYDSLAAKRNAVSQSMVMRFKGIEDAQPTPEQRERMVHDEIVRRLNAFDHGMVRNDMTMNEFFNGPYGANYIMSCCYEAKRKRQQNSVLKLYDPEKLHELFRYNDPNRFPLLNPKPDYDTLVSSEEYKRRRQLFIDSIYQKNSLGTLHGGPSVG